MSEVQPSAKALDPQVICSAGIAVVALLAGGVGGWAATTELSGAVIAPGSLVVELERQEGAASDRRRRRRAAGPRRR